MHAYLVIGRNKEAIKKEVSQINLNVKAKILEYPLRKIEDVRDLEKFLKLKLEKNTIIFIENIDKASVDALNAFLKNLEEPQPGLTFILTANTIFSVIPTIISRCQIIRLKDTYSIDSKTSDTLTDFLSLSREDKISYINSITTKEGAITFLENLIIWIYVNMNSGNGNLSALAKIAEEADKTRFALAKNANINLHLTNFVLNI